MAKISKEQAIIQLWEAGELSWKLKGKQKDIYQNLKEAHDRISTILVSRRFGKSFVNCLLAVETCLKGEDVIVKYACPKQKMVKTIIKPIMRIILKDCPEHLKPIFHEQDKVYRFEHNNSEIQIAGTDGGRYDDLRGGYAQLCILDEAGFMDELEDVVYSVLLPTTDTTGGRLILTSTPNSKDPQHAFHEIFVNPAKASNKLIKYTLWDSPMLTQEQKDQKAKEFPGGDQNQKYRTEYLCEIPKDTEFTVIPEYNDEKEAELLLPEETKAPDYFDAYVSMDVGFKDLTGAIFAYYDFKEACLIIQDELVMNGPEMTTDRLAKEISNKEKLRFYNEQMNEQITPTLRIMDNDLKLINDLSRLHEINFIATQKDNKEAAINELRMWIHNNRIKIHPRCKHLRYHLRSGEWDKHRRKFKHLKDSLDGEVRGGHADLLDALIYLVRNIVQSKNPFPDNYNEMKGPDVFRGRPREKNGTMTEFMHKVLNIKGKKGS